MLEFEQPLRPYKWDKVKSRRLKIIRGKSFDEVTTMKFLQERKNPSRQDQMLLLFEENGRVWAVPCIFSDHEVFCKTLYQSRKYTKMFHREEL